MRARLVDTLFPVRRGERPLTLALFLHSLFAVGAFITGRAMRDALFLAQRGRGELPWMYVAAALAVTLTGLLHARWAARVRRDRFAAATAALFAAGFVALWFFERSRTPWAYRTLYVYVEVMGAVVLGQFWALANDLFHAREARRLYGLIGAGGTFATIGVGFASSRVALTWGTSALIWVCALLLLGATSTAIAAGRLGRQKLFARAVAGRVSARVSGGLALLAGSPHLREVAVLVAITFVTTTVVDFQFKVIAGSVYRGDALAAYFGAFNGTVGLIALSLQLFGTSRLLARLGVIGALVLLPASLGLGQLGLALLPVLGSAAFTKGADTVLRYSVNDPTTQLLYLPVPSPSRASARAFIENVVKPLAIGAAGLGLLFARPMLEGRDLGMLAWFGLGLCAIWLAVVGTLRSKYVRSLQLNLNQRRLERSTGQLGPLRDPTGATSLARALDGGTEREVLGALELLPRLEDPTFERRVEALLEHSSSKVRRAAVAYFGRRQAMRYASSIFRRLEDEDPLVRAAAIEAFCAMGRDKAVRSVRPYLADPSPEIRSAAITGMIRFGGLDGVVSAAEALKALIADADAAMRAHAARTLGAIGVSNFYQPVLQLMNDPELSVRRHAIASAGALRSPEFVIPLLYKTQVAATQRESVAALAEFGAAVVPTMAKVLDNPLEDAGIRRAAARVLGRVCLPEAAAIVTRHLQDEDEALRARLYRALAKAVRTRNVGLADSKPVTAALAWELSRAYAALFAAELLGLEEAAATTSSPPGHPAPRLLASALREKIAEGERRIFTLLAVLYPDAAIEGIHAGIRAAAAPAEAARRRANAVELLDNLLDRPLKRRLLPLLEDLPRRERLRQISPHFPPPATTPGEALAALGRDGSAWVRACAVWHASQLGPSGAEQVRQGETDESPMVREIAQRCRPVSSGPGARG